MRRLLPALVILNVLVIGGLIWLSSRPGAPDQEHSIPTNHLEESVLEDDPPPETGTSQARSREEVIEADAAASDDEWRRIPTWREPVEGAARWESGTQTSVAGARSDSGPAGETRSGQERPTREGAERVGRSERSATGRSEELTRSQPLVTPPSARTSSEPAVPKEETPVDPESDTTPPALVSMRFEIATVEGGGTAPLVMNASDDLSGVRSLVGRLQSSVGSASVTFSAQSSAPGETAFRSEVRLPERAPNGVWFVSFLRLIDFANNSANLRWSGPADPGTAVIRIASEDGDGTPPQVVSVDIQQVSVEPGGEVLIDVIVTDEGSGVANVSGAVVSPSGSAHLPIFGGEESGADRWVARVRLPEEAECGEWKMSRLQAADKAGNRVSLPASDPRLAQRNFYVSFGGDCDDEAPVLSTASISPSTVSNSEDSVVVMSAIVSDLGSGVAYVSGIAQPENAQGGQGPRISFVLQRKDQSGDTWSGEIRVPKFSAVGRWVVRSLRIADKARNQRTYGYHSSPELANAWFVVE